MFGIENKIQAPLYYDLDDYSRSVSAAAERALVPQSRIHCVLLTLRGVSDSDAARARRSGFVPVTYRELIRRVRDRLGHYAAAADAKFLIYFNDFMETLEQLAGLPMDPLRSQFFDRRASEIEVLAAEWQAYRKRRIEAVRALVRPWPAPVCRQSVWEKYAREHEYSLVHDFQTLAPEPGKIVAVDLGRDAERWSMVVWPRTADADYFKREIAPQLASDFAPELTKIEKDLPPTASDSEVAAALDVLLAQVAQALGHTVLPS